MSEKTEVSFTSPFATEIVPRCVWPKLSTKAVSDKDTATVLIYRDVVSAFLPILLIEFITVGQD